MCQIGDSAFLTNYLAVYVLFAASIPLLYLTVVLEERELVLLGLSPLREINATSIRSGHGETGGRGWL